MSRFRLNPFSKPQVAEGRAIGGRRQLTVISISVGALLVAGLLMNTLSWWWQNRHNHLLYKTPLQLEALLGPAETAVSYAPKVSEIRVRHWLGWRTVHVRSYESWNFPGYSVALDRRGLSCKIYDGDGALFAAGCYEGRDSRDPTIIKQRATDEKE